MSPRFLLNSCVGIGGSHRQQRDLLLPTMPLFTTSSSFDKITQIAVFTFTKEEHKQSQNGPWALFWSRDGASCPPAIIAIDDVLMSFPTT